MNVTDKEIWLLKILRENPFLPQIELAKRIGLSRSATANLLSGLQQKGYIKGRAYIIREAGGIVGIGGANIDHKILLLSEHQSGTSNPVRSKKSPGGVMRNICENLGRLGEKVQLMTIVGKDAEGESLLQSGQGLFSTRLTDRIEDGQTGVYHAVLDLQGSLVAGYADMEIAGRMNGAWIRQKRAEYAHADWVVADGNLTADALATLLALSRSDGFPLALIGVSAPKMQRFPENLEGLGLILCNVDESQAYLHTKESDPKVLASMWLLRGVKRCVVTAGKNPVAFGEKEIHSLPIPVVSRERIVDVTGCGDAFSAGVLFGLNQGKTLEEACRMGEICARITLQSEESVHPMLNEEMIREEILNAK